VNSARLSLGAAVLQVANGRGPYERRQQTPRLLSLAELADGQSVVADARCVQERREVRSDEPQLAEKPRGDKRKSTDRQTIVARDVQGDVPWKSALAESRRQVRGTRRGTRDRTRGRNSRRHGNSVETACVFRPECRAEMRNEEEEISCASQWYD